MKVHSSDAMAQENQEDRGSKKGPSPGVLTHFPSLLGVKDSMGCHIGRQHPDGETGQTRSLFTPLEPNWIF